MEGDHVADLGVDGDIKLCLRETGCEKVWTEFYCLVNKVEWLGYVKTVTDLLPKKRSARWSHYCPISDFNKLLDSC
jgi:hypothetical protein